MADPTPWIVAEDSGAVRKHAPATLRNRGAIAERLRAVLPSAGLVLEVASGSGEHCACFAETFPALDWQPSDPDETARASIAAWCAGLVNVHPPMALDAAARVWPVAHADAVLCINMAHISPWPATLGLMASAGRLLPAGGPLVLYGPFLRPETETAPSNIAFDESLRARDPAWGLRDMTDVTSAALGAGLLLDQVIEMPANNLFIVFRRA